MIPNTPQPKTSIATSILARITGEQITPTPRYSFVLREGFLVSLVLLSIFLGTLAVAVMIFILVSANYSLYEATHSNFTTFLFDVLPALWVLIFVLLTVLVRRQLRFIKTGYRYSATNIIVGSLTLSCLGGLLLHGLGFGYALDQFLGKQVSMYISMEKMELSLWQMPAAGRLVGFSALTKGTEGTFDTETDTVFIDIEGTAWILETAELDHKDEAFLQSGQEVRLLGTSTAPGFFHTCGVFAWMFGDDWGIGRREMDEERQRFEAKLKFHQNRLQTGTGIMVSPPDNTMICAHREMMRVR